MLLSVAIGFLWGLGTGATLTLLGPLVWAAAVGVAKNVRVWALLKVGTVKREASAVYQAPGVRRALRVYAQVKDPHDLPAAWAVVDLEVQMARLEREARNVARGLTGKGSV